MSGGQGIRGRAIVFVTGQCIVLENTSTEYYTARTASSSVSSNQGLASRNNPLPTFKKSGNTGRE